MSSLWAMFYVSSRVCDIVTLNLTFKETNVLVLVQS